MFNIIIAIIFGIILMVAVMEGIYIATKQKVAREESEADLMKKAIFANGLLPELTRRFFDEISGHEHMLAEIVEKLGYPICRVFLPKLFARSVEAANVLRDSYLVEDLCLLLCKRGLSENNVVIVADTRDINEVLKDTALIKPDEKDSVHFLTGTIFVAILVFRKDHTLMVCTRK